MQPALEAESAVGDKVRGVVEDILMAKSSAVKSPRQQIPLRRLLHSSLSAKASPSVDTRDEASDEAVADAMKETPPPVEKKPTPKRKKLTPKNLGSMAQFYLVKNPRGGATASRGLQAKKECLLIQLRALQVVHDDVHTDVDCAKLEKGTLPTPTTVKSGTDAIVDAMVVDACTDAIVDAMIVDACTNDIVDAMKIDASTKSTVDGNANDGGTESIVHAIIDPILDAVKAMGTDATVESGTNAIVDAMVVDACIDAIADDACTNDIVNAMEVDASTDAAAAVVCPSDAADDIVDAEEAKGIDAAVEDMRGLRPRCVFSALDYIKLQRGPSQYPSANRVTIRLALEFVGKPYDLPASSNANRLTIRLADECSEDPRCVFSALNYVKSQRGLFKHSSARCMHPSASRITTWLALENVGKPYDLLSSSNASRLTIRLADECLEGTRCVFSALNCVKLQCGSSEHASASRITIRLALELVGKPYDLPTSSNANRLTIRLADGCSEGLRYIFSALDYVKSQRKPSKHSSASNMASRITIRLALELVGKPYDLPASSNASRLIIQFVDGCSKGPCCVFSALNCVKLQRELFEHPSISRITIRLTLEFVSKAYDLSASSNASRITKRLVDVCSEDLCCVFSALDCVKLQRRSSEHPSVNRIIIRSALRFQCFDCVKLQCGPFEHPSAIRITIRLALELAGKSYDLSASSNASRLTIRLTDGCSEGPRCVFSALNCVKLQRRPSEHPLASRITIRLALKLVDKPYDLPTSSNASRITKRIVDGCLESPRYVFSALDCVKLQRGSFEHTSANRISIRLALKLTDKPYDLPTSSHASRVTIRLVDGCSEGLHCVKLQRGPSEHPSASRITIQFVLELADKSYDLPTSFNASRLTIQLADGCSEGPRCVFNALNCVKLQQRPSEHPSISRITIRIALELAGNPYDLPTSSNASRLTMQLADVCSKGPRCVVSVLNCIKLQHGPSEQPSASRITIRLALELVSKAYDLPASHMICRQALMQVALPNGLSMGARKVRVAFSVL
ncbi:hypothetical protein L7F22_056135 [Adiantum nelumboides]|nr:hypothetical protein [Adiantum nelumboides]